MLVSPVSYGQWRGQSARRLWAPGTWLCLRTLVVQQLFSRLRSILGVRAFDNGVDRAGFLAEAAVDALGHVDIVACGSAGAIGTLLSFDGDSLGRADLHEISVHGLEDAHHSTLPELTASQSLQAMHRSSPVGYRRRACSPRKRGEMGPCCRG